MPLQSLPFDIHARIIQFVYILSQSQNIDYPTLSACALVCKDWTAPAQHLLFRRIVRPSDIDAAAILWLKRAAPLLLRAFASRPHLSTYVRSIAVHDLPDCVELLRRCPHIAMVHLLNVDPPLLEELHALHALDLRPSVLVVSAPMDRDAVHAALAALPSVRHYVSLEDPAEWGIAPLDLALPSAAQLLSVTSKHTTIDSSRLCVQPATVPAAEIQFEDLDLKYFYFDDITSVDLGIARGLRALTSQIVPSNAVLKELTALESLIICSLSTWPPTFPRTLQHFGFHAYQDYSGYKWDGKAQSIREFVSALARPPNLRVVSVTRCTDIAVRLALKKASASRGVDFVEYAHPDAYPVCLPEFSTGRCPEVELQRARYVDWLS
ncbi:hypothetical protein FA95DRAFT_1567602 [Auriscalpium vulgare]|uniref:Uncharacterized protein n=1 Tax=Auriscalpium vulgare TaxID=40419 RepID=A0ACB8R465_9AGAM|nr:hypothetical protein FA95DRAFT_1567602 [Auriscalpium vulgare]